VSYAPRGRARVRRPGARRGDTYRRRRAAALIGAGVLLLVVVLVVSGLGGGSVPKPPPAGTATGAGAGDPFVYRAAQESDYVSRAVTGNAQPLFTKSPGGAVATAERVAALRPLVDRVTAGTGIDPSLLEGLVFVESAGLPQVIAGNDPADAAGLTQILAQTGQSLLGMHINLARSRRLTAQINAVQAGFQGPSLTKLYAQRAAIDDRFNPTRELEATVRYLRLAEAQFGRQDLAFESYHMGIGNLHQVLTDYDGGRAVPYPQLYFDTAPDRHAAAYSLLAGFGDDSSLYYWRLLGAEQIMHLYRTDRAALIRLVGLEDETDSDAPVLHPPNVTQTFSDPSALAAAYQRRALVPLPTNLAALGLVPSPGMGSHARAVGAPAGLYRGLRPVALRTLIVMAARVRSLSGGANPLRIASTVSDAQYQRASGQQFAAATNGYSFQLERRYVSHAQAEALQAVLDRLQSLNLIAWAREPTVIDVTVASDAARWLR
jgi:hypothetical protein